tara:strand:+ start:28827 stop:29621 length:795 start_codon:yes stop_codon:yes gene_type:complete
MKYDALIFDIDGVLIDTSKSFNSAVIKAISIFTGTNIFSTKELRSLRSIGGFNNDWYAAIAGAAWVTFAGHLTFSEYLQLCKRSKKGIDGVRKQFPKIKESFEQRITQIVQEAYGGKTACEKLYGFKPSILSVPGFWKSEVSMIDLDFMEKYKQIIGICTGRNHAETELAFSILGWSIDLSYVALSDYPELDKPNPYKLTKVINNLNSDYPIYFGDTMDDLELVKEYRIKTGKNIDFCLVGSSLELDGYDYKTDSLMKFLRGIE